jgi:hypothetical protein
VTDDPNAPDYCEEIVKLFDGYILSDGERLNASRL